MGNGWGGARNGAGRKRKHSLGELVVSAVFCPRTTSHLRALAEGELELPDDFPTDVADGGSRSFGSGTGPKARSRRRGCFENRR